jgi:energy-coupling factor transport system substrate-specific component
VSTRRAALLRADRSGYRKSSFVTVDGIAQPRDSRPRSTPANDRDDEAPIGGLFARISADARARFLVAGGFATLVNWVVRFPLDIYLPYAAAVALAAVMHMSCSFVLYRSWVFPGSQRRLVEQIRDFALVNIVGMAVTVGLSVLLRQALLSVGVDSFSAGAVAHLIGIASGAVAGYLGHGRVTFR